MADYYPLLVRAISSLPQNTAENRRAVFDRARAALMRQLRSVDPPLPEGEITRERLTLEEAIRRVEADFAPQDNEPEGELEPAPDVHEAPGDVEPADNFPDHPQDVDAASGDDGHPDPRDRQESFGTAAPMPPPLVRTSGGDAGDDKDADAAPRPGEPRPPLQRGTVRSREAAKEAGKDMRRPGLRPAGEKSSSWKKPALWAFLVVLLLIVIGLFVVNRDLILGGSQSTTSAPAAATREQAERPKSTDRVAAAASEESRRAPAAPARQQVAGTQRAVLLEESPGGTSAPQTFEGTVTWRTETFDGGPGLPPEVGIRGVVTIPERQISMDFVLRRNTDQALPASHTIELQFKLPENFAFGGIANVPGIRVKPNQQAQGVPLAGLTVRVNPQLFLVGLSTEPQDRQRNITLLQVYPWLDVPFVYTNNTRAVILFDKGETGDQVFQDAFSAWGELVERQPAPPPQ